jgi:hypothetical protein
LKALSKLVLQARFNLAERENLVEIPHRQILGNGRQNRFAKIQAEDGPESVLRIAAGCDLGLENEHVNPFGSTV